MIWWIILVIAVIVGIKEGLEYGELGTGFAYTMLVWFCLGIVSLLTGVVFMESGIGTESLPPQEIAVDTISIGTEKKNTTLFMSSNVGGVVTVMPMNIQSTDEYIYYREVETGVLTSSYLDSSTIQYSEENKEAKVVKYTKTFTGLTRFLYGDYTGLIKTEFLLPLPTTEGETYEYNTK